MPAKTILLVEDNLNDIELVLNAFRRNNLPNTVTTARHGGEALDYLYRRGTFADRTGEDPVFIMLDLKMPRVDGHEVLRQVKSDARLKFIPIVMLTSSNEETDVHQSYQLGVNAYVVKPVDFTEFVDTIRHIGIFWSRLNVTPTLAAA